MYRGEWVAFADMILCRRFVAIDMGGSEREGRREARAFRSVWRGTSSAVTPRCFLDFANDFGDFNEGGDGGSFFLSSVSE